MSLSGVASAAAPKRRVRTRALVRVSVVAAAWGAFVCWWLLVMQGEALMEAARAAFWLLRTLSVYLGLLACWVILNKAMSAAWGPPKLRAGEQPAFDKDYFGRPVAVASGATFNDQHLVLAYEDGRKLYRTPTADDMRLAPETAVSANVRALAAAAGAGVSPSSSPSAEEAESETHADDL
jgi:hypothetical protein